MKQLWRYYQAGIVNTLFGYGIYAVLLTVGVWMYAAQLMAHVLGVAFNYFTYSRHTFAEVEASKQRFVLSYALNYVLGLAGLAVASRLIASPYAAGLLSIFLVSLINFFVLKNIVFVRTTSSLKPVESTD
jgi:putative flippase GtrA